MNREKAVEILTTAPVNHSGRLIVRDEKYKDKLVEKAKYFHQSSDSILISFDSYRVDKKEESTYSGNYKKGFVNATRFTEEQQYSVCSSLEELFDKESSFKSANYIFIDKPFAADPAYNGYQGGVNFFITSYSIIGEKEIAELREIFYKDVRPDILSAMNSLGIKNYIALYDAYFNGGVNEEFLETYDIYLKFVGALSDLFPSPGSPLSLISWKSAEVLLEI